MIFNQIISSAAIKTAQIIDIYHIQRFKFIVSIYIVTRKHESEELFHF